MQQASKALQTSIVVEHHPHPKHTHVNVITMAAIKPTPPTMAPTRTFESGGSVEPV